MVRPKYEAHFPRQMQLRDHLAFVLATTSIPTSIVENSDFKEWVDLLDNRHKLPCIKTANEDMEHLCESGIAIIKEMIGKMI